MEKAKVAQKSAPKSNKYGDVRKCPTCGAMVESFQTKCPECGYEFRNIEANSTTQKLLDALDAINAQTTNQGVVSSVLSGFARAYGFDSATMRKCQIIQNFPIPNTKEDLIEMLSLAHTNAEKRFNDIGDESLYIFLDSILYLVFKFFQIKVNQTMQLDKCFIVFYLECDGN